MVLIQLDVPYVRTPSSKSDGYKITKFKTPRAKARHYINNVSLVLHCESHRQAARISKWSHLML